jgi:hypothetical protein
VVLFINRQNNYLANVNPGFEKGNIIYANTNDNILNSIQPFKNELKKIPGIDDITFAQHRIGAIDQNLIFLWITISLMLRGKPFTFRIDNFKRC